MGVVDRIGESMHNPAPVNATRAATPVRRLSIDERLPRRKTRAAVSPQKHQMLTCHASMRVNVCP